MKITSRGFTLLLTQFVCISIMTAQTQLSTIEQGLQEVKKNFAPDKRTVLFQYQLIEDATNNISITGETTSEALYSSVIELSTMKQVNHSGFLLLPDGLKEQPFGIISVSVANIRTKPEHSAELATQALMGTVVKLYKKSEDWYFIQTPDQYLGWVDPEAITAMSKNELAEYKSSEKLIITKPGQFVYTDSEQKSIVSDLTEGNIISCYSKNINGYKVTLPDGRDGFVSANSGMGFSDWIKEVSSSSENLMRTAKAFMGFPYLWGGTSGKGMDCSGFTKMVYFLNGTILPRDASQQVYAGASIEGSDELLNLMPGDLLFFGEKATEGKKERVTHVGLYLGNMEFIHSSGKIKINSLNPKADNYSFYRHKQYLRARRFVDSEWIKTAAIKTNPHYQFIKE